ncbi:HEAT repeat domain-containing protein [Streptomyces sp. H10-C2]|uniref:HEAT repeat domain-containing protein n=1 Tax=unclassified Streptomyces TaxID=2593676 RepID=UPI0024BBB361|nr:MULTISPECIES: HEAT repeat domain-containing protein [unclassified Streptomyces]MDJ0340512.1 HEAT repeat domain-containing protein [Streptomyces sp. PH10-H1]MDJ0370160.1 HEAT repeat domain-containing protein [Streptomyces sp. H10-C2]
MLAGLYEIDWAAMGHAYGSAEEVPELLRGLASADAGERETALDAMYGAVHHQGDVYDSTLACIPFLFELAADPAVRDRGRIVVLLTSIGGGDEVAEEFLDEIVIEAGSTIMDDTWSAAGGTSGNAPGADGNDGMDATGTFGAIGAPGAEDILGLLDTTGAAAAEDAETAAWRANYAMAVTAVRAQAEGFVALITDPDPDVRRAVPVALGALHGETARILDILRKRLPAEEDTETRLALVEAVGTLALRPGGHAADAADWLARLAGGRSGGPFDPGLRLAALAQLARCAPARLPEDIVPTAVTLLREVRGEVPAARSPQASSAERSAPATFVGHLRELRERAEAGRSAPWAADLLRTLHTALDDRVDDRIALVIDQLRSPDWGQRIDAVWMSGGLVRGWRGPYEELVVLLGQQLADPEYRLREGAASVLENLYELAAPAADALAEAVAAHPESWVQEWSQGRPSLGGMVKTLARLGDARALPALVSALDRPDIPQDLGYAIEHLGEAAAPLAPLLRRRLAEVTLDDEVYDQAEPLLRGLAVVSAAEAMPEVLRLLRGAPKARRDWLLCSAIRALARFGPAAREALPDLRALVADPGSCIALEAASALWAIERNTAVLPVLIAHLDCDSPHTRRSAAEVLGEIGPAAAGAAPRLRELLADSAVWMRVDVAVALWRITGDAGPVLPVLRAAWAENVHTRAVIAGCLAELGPAAAAPLLRAELAAVRRHNNEGDHYGTLDVCADEKLLLACRRALARISAPEPVAGDGR